MPSSFYCEVVKIICIYDSKETIFNNNGLVVLNDTIAATVSEELNGNYELELEYPLNNTKWQYLTEGNIIKCDGQLFRIYHKVKNLTSIKINARHIFYDLLDNFLEDVRPTNLSGYGALDYILTHTQYPHNFISMGDVGGSNTRYFVRKNPVEAIMGQDGIINTWGGELARDNYTIKLLNARGLDRGVLIAYGKNIIGIEETLDIDSICTRLMPIGANGLLLSEKYIDSQYINNFPHPKIKTMEFDDIENEEELRIVATKYMTDNKIDIPQFNYKIDFIELSKTEEYKNYSILETVYLGDTVTIKHSKLNINLKAKVIKITKNCITNRIENIELGSFKPNIATSINNSIQEVKQEVKQVTSDYQKAIDNATALITGSKGGNVVIRGDAEGHPQEILIMDTTNINTAQNVWRWDSGGFGHSSTGYNGTFDTAITQDGHIVASFIQALTIKGEQIIAGIIASKDDKVNFNLDGKTFRIGNSDTDYKLYYDGTNLKIQNVDIDISNNSSITGAKDYTDLQVKILNNSIALKVNADGVINAINVSPEGVKLNANKIDLSSINGTDVRTVGTSNYLHMYGAHLDMFINNVDKFHIGIFTDEYGDHPVLAFGVPDSNGYANMILLTHDYGDAETQDNGIMQFQAGKSINISARNVYIAGGTIYIGGNLDVSGSTVKSHAYYFDNGYDVSNPAITAQNVGCIDFYTRSGCKYQLTEEGCLYYYKKSDSSWHNIAGSAFGV